MPAQSVESSPGHRVMVHTCEGCGARADFGTGVNLRAAMATGNKALAGKWFCGWRDGAPVCINAPQHMNRKD